MRVEEVIMLAPSASSPPNKRSGTPLRDSAMLCIAVAGAAWIAWNWIGHPGQGGRLPFLGSGRGGDMINLTDRRRQTDIAGDREPHPGEANPAMRRSPDGYSQFPNDSYYPGYGEYPKSPDWNYFDRYESSPTRRYYQEDYR